MKAVIRVTPSSYEIGDIIKTYQDDYEFGSADLRSGEREVITIPDLTDAERYKLEMQDKQINLSIGRMLPAFRSLATSHKNLKVKRRRKYHYNEGVKLKSNAQT